MHVGYETDESRSFIVDSRATTAAADDDQDDDDNDCYNETAERHHHVPHITCHVITHTATPSFSHSISRITAVTSLSMPLPNV